MAEGDDKKETSQNSIDVTVKGDEDDAETAEDNSKFEKANDSGVKPKEAAATAAVAEEQPFLRNLKILPPRQKQGCETFDDRRCVALPPIRAEEPVASLRAALGEVVGYAHLTHYRFVLENEPLSTSPSAGDSKAAEGSGRLTKGVQQGGGAKKGKKKKKSASPTSSGEGKAEPMDDVITPYTGLNAVVCAPAAVRSLESDPSRKAKTAAATNDEDKTLVLDDYGDLNPLLEKGLGDGSAFRIVLERYDVAGVRDHVARLRGLFAGGNVPAAITLADEEAAGKGSEELARAGDNEKDDSIAEAGAVASAVAAAPKGKDDGQESQTDADASTAEKAIEAKKESGGANSSDENQKKEGKAVKAKKSVELMPEFNLDQKVSANGSDLTHFYYLSCGEEDAVRAIQTSTEGCGDDAVDNQPADFADATIEELAAAVESSSASPKQHKKKNGKQHHKNGKHKGKSAEDSKAETTSAEKKIAEAKENIAFNRKLNELESDTVVPCTVRYSGFHPPPRSRRVMGDLAYLEVETPAFPDEPAVHITAGPTGFYVNRTKGGRGSGSTGYVFDPSPALDPCFSHDLLDCLLQKSASLRSAWAHALSMSKERARLAAKLSASDGPLQALHRVAVRNDAGGTTTPVPATQGIDSIVLRPSWLVPFPSDQTSSSVRKQSNAWNHNAMHGFDTNHTEDDLSSTFGLDIRGGALRDWNEELQSAREMPTESLQDRIERARMIHKVLSDFGEASLAGAQSIFDGHISPMNPNEPTRSHVYLHNNIFFSRAVDAGVDTFKIAQGDGAARKSASRDAQCIGAIHRLDVKGLHTLATVLVDYLGTRLVCQSIVPGILHGEKTHTLLYGAVEATSPLSWDKEMHNLLEDTLGKGLMVASRPVPTLPLSDERMEEIERLKTVVLPLDDREKAEDKDKKDGTKKTTTVCGPIEAKGIRGSDQRKYILDLTRVTPRDANWVPKAFGGTGHWEDDLDVSGSGKANLLSSKLEEYVPKSLEDDEWTTAVLRPELVTNFTHKKMSEWLEAKISAEAETVGKGRVDTKPDDRREKEAENEKSGAESTKTPASAPDINDDLKSSVSIRRRSIGPEDEEHLQTLRLNLNVFLPHVKSLKDLDEEAFEETKKDEIVVREMASYLWSTLLPKLTQEMRDNSGHQIPVDGSSLTELLHQRGINCRYMGRLATLAAQEESKDRKAEADVQTGVATTLPRRVMPVCWLEMLECEMVARAAKHVLDGYFTENAGAAGNQPSQTVASFLSAIMSSGEESAAETEVRGQEDDKGKRMVPDEDDMNGLTMFDTGGGGDAIPPPIRGRAEVWEDIEREIGRRFRYVLTLYNRPAASHTASKAKSDQKRSSRALYIPLLRRICQRNGIRLVARDYAVGGKCLCSGGNSSGGRMTASHPISPMDIVDILPLMKHSAAHGGEGFVATTFNGTSVGSPSLHVLLPDAKATLEAAHVNWNARTLPAALDLAQEAASLYQRVVDTPLHSSVGRCLDLIAVILFQANEPELAVANAARALAVSVQLGGFDSAEAVTAHSTLSHVLISSGRLAVGVKHLRAALYLMELMAGPRYAELANVYHKLGTMYHEMGSGINALRFYQEAATRKSCDRMVEGMVAKSTALVLAALGQFKAALESEKRAYSIYRCILGEDHDLTKNSGNTLKQFMKVAVEQGTRMAAEDKKRKEQQAADAIATKIEADETEEEKKKSKKKKTKKKKNKS